MHGSRWGPVRKPVKKCKTRQTSHRNKKKNVEPKNYGNRKGIVLSNKAETKKKSKV